MKFAYLIVFSTFLVLTVSLAAAKSPEATEAIKTAAHDYGDGWYEGNAERMERALHPELAKRVVFLRPRSGRSGLNQMGAMTLVEFTRMGGGKNAPVDKGPSEVTILDVFENAAVVRVVGPEWVDYLHMARWNGRWVIVNVLWEPKPEHRERLYGLLAG
jgi:hypothetical protein